MKRSIIILALTGLALTLGNTGCNRPTNSTIGLTPELQEVAALAQNRTSDENIIGYIRNSGKGYKVTANDIVILTKNGVSQNVIGALMQQPAPAAAAPAVVPTASVAVAPAAPVAPATPAAAPVIVNVNNTQTAPAEPVATAAAPSTPVAMAPAPGAPEPPPSPEYFETQLAPYGQWMFLPEFGTRCWVPNGLPPGWRPYFDSGHWVYTDSGMFWESEHPWGAIPFHYGRWVFRGSWLWVPAYEYAPAWVIWRHGEGHMGWAPVPFGATFVSGGWEFHGRHVAVDFDFGLSPTLFVFVGGNHFLDRDFHRHEMHGEEWHRAFAHSEMNHFVHDEHGHGFRVEGFERTRVEIIVGRKVEPVRHEEVRGHALENLHHNAVHEGPAHPRVEPSAHGPAHDDKPEHGGGKPASPAHEGATHAPTEPATHAPTHEEKVSHPVSKPVTQPKDAPVHAPVEPATHAPAHEEKVGHPASTAGQTQVSPTPGEPVTHAPVREEKGVHPVSKPAPETSELPVQPRTEPVVRAPAREDRSTRAGGRPSAVDNPSTTDNPGKSAPTDSKRKRKNSDQPTADQN